MDGSTWISLFSLFVAGGTAAYTYRFSRTRQRLNELLIEEKQAEQEDAKRAIFQIEITGTAPQYSLSIENVGAAPAFDVFFASEGPDNEFAKGLGAVNPLTHFPHSVIEPGRKLTYAYVRFLEHTHEPCFSLRWRDTKGPHDKKYEPVRPR
tara:strand:+ start:16 stop:468 length:453 start_codon:yes stop_codon:yes gene_type:complete